MSLRPRRLLKRLRPLALRTAPVLASGLKLCWKTARISVQGEENLVRLLEQERPFIPCCWHQRQLVCAQYLLDRRRGNLRIGLLISPSHDGEFATVLATQWGAPIIRGSSSRNSGQTIRDVYQALVKQRICPILTPDGPRGPAQHFKVGTAVLAQISGAPLLPMAYAAGRAWRLRSWDRFLIPWPFSRVFIVVGRPVAVPPRLTLEELQPYRREMENTLNDLVQQAEKLLQGSA